MVNRLSLKGKIIMMVMLNIAVSIVFNGISIYSEMKKSKYVDGIINDGTQSILILNELAKNISSIEINLNTPKIMISFYFLLNQSCIKL